LDANLTPLKTGTRDVVFLVMYVACFFEQRKKGGAGPFFVGAQFFTSLYSVKKSLITHMP
jgi:hypothetical protein